MYIQIFETLFQMLYSPSSPSMPRLSLIASMLFRSVSKSSTTLPDPLSPLFWRSSFLPSKNVLVLLLLLLLAPTDLPDSERAMSSGEEAARKEEEEEL